MHPNQTLPAVEAQAVTQAIAVLQLCRDGRERSVDHIASMTGLPHARISTLLALLQAANVAFEVITDTQNQPRYRISAAWLARTPLTKEGVLRKNNTGRPTHDVTKAWVVAVRRAMQQQDRTIHDVAAAAGIRYASLLAVLTGRILFSGCVGPVSEVLGIAPTLAGTWVRRPRTPRKPQRLFGVTDAWLSAVRVAMTSDQLSRKALARAAHVSYGCVYSVLHDDVSRSTCVPAITQALRLEEVDGVWQRRKK